uniref:Hyccin n=1 Tax=Setaria digitata TaxID=48799 RepID=A0A915Q6I1_9BILA
MNSEQLQDWLTDLNERWKSDSEKRALKDIEHERTQLTRETCKTHYLINYLNCSYTDVDLVQPVIAQLLACYYRGGILRYFVMQCIPSLIHLYLLAIAKRQRKSVSMFETFFLAMYNEEILAGGPLSGSLTKKVEEVRIPSIRFPSVYHDPRKLNLTPDITLKPGTPAFVQSTVRVGPYKSVDKIIPQNRQIVLTRLLKSVNACLCRLSRDVICRSICLSTIAICQSGFAFHETLLKSPIFGSIIHSEGSDDLSKKPRLRTSSQYLLESLNALYFALFNGTPDLAVQAVGAVHQRALYEFYADVILVTNSINEILLENDFHKNEELTADWVRPGKPDICRGSELVTNASLRLKKMPEDISPVVDDDIKGFNFSDSVGSFKKRISVKVEQHKLKRQFGHHRRRSENSEENAGDIELDPINEEPVAPVNAAVFHGVDQAIHEDLSSHRSLSRESANSDNNASISFRSDRVHNGTPSKAKNEVIDPSVPATNNDSSEVARPTSVEPGVHDLAKWHGNIQHIDSVTDAFENISL